MSLCGQNQTPFEVNTMQRDATIDGGVGVRALALTD
jgi:hypothetical protein